MFYAHFVLAKKGPLARIWLAAHWDKKLTKAQVYETNIEESVQGIMQPKVKMALRTSGHLLLGVVRIYSRKAKYLLADCNEAFAKIKMAFRPGQVDLPENMREAAVNLITLPDYFQDVDTEVPGFEDMIDFDGQFVIGQQTRIDEITLREDYGDLMLDQQDDGFGGAVSLEAPEVMRDVVRPPTMGNGTGSIELSLSNDTSRLRDVQLNRESSFDRPGIGSKDDEFVRLSEELFANSVAGPQDVGLTHDDSALQNDVGAADDAVPGSRPITPLEDTGMDIDLVPERLTMAPPTLDQTPNTSTILPRVDAVSDNSAAAPQQVLTPSVEAPQQHDQTTLLQNEEESFALAPVEASALKGTNTKRKRKRKIIVDTIKSISAEDMKNQLIDYDDIITTLDIAPPTKRLMQWKEMGGCDELYSLPCHQITNNNMLAHYNKGLKLYSTDEDQFTFIQDPVGGDLELDYVPIEPSPQKSRPSKRKRADDKENSYAKRQQELVRQQEQFAKKIRRESNVSISMPLQQISLQQMSLVEDGLGTSQFSPAGSVALDIQDPMQDQTIQHDMSLPPPAPPSITESQALATSLGDFVPASPLPEVEPFSASTNFAPATPALSLGSDDHVARDDIDLPQFDVDDHQIEDFDDNYDDIEVQSVIRQQQDFNISSEQRHGNKKRKEQSVEQALQQEELSGGEDTVEDESLLGSTERVVNKRAAQLHALLQSQNKNQIEFSSLVESTSTKKTVAQTFYSFLVLSKHDAVSGSQDSIFAPILINKTPAFASAIDNL